MNLIKVDPNEILFIRQNAPHGMMVTLANNVGLPHQKVRNEFITLKDEYDEKMIDEARRLLKANTGKEFKPVQEVA